MQDDLEIRIGRPLPLLPEDVADKDRLVEVRSLVPYWLSAETRQYCNQQNITLSSVIRKQLFKWVLQQREAGRME